ncbi:MAG: hypothetical protein MK116_10175 [Phycisphaerales bacterium]|nr:hypothetical protein [Phycisphaerales bacterium]
MDKLTLYLEVVPLPIIGGAGFAMMMLYLILPADTRFYATFIIMPAWLVIARCPDLGPAQAFTKITSGLLFLLIALAAVMRPVPKRPIPGLAWLYPLFGTYLLMCLLGVEERTDVLVIQFQWIMLTLAALATVSTLSTIEDVEALMKALTVGTVIALAIPIAAVILNPGELFGNIGRFTPWGAHPNLIGVAFLMAAPILLYTIMTTASVSIRAVLIGLLLADIGMAMVTGSRQVVFAMAAALGLMSFPLLKRPGLVLTGIVAGALVLPFFLGLSDYAVERLGSIDSSGRLDIWWQYFMLSLQRPLGLFGTSGLNSHIAISVGDHPHNMFFEMLYLGGWPYFLPMFIVILSGIRAMWRVWRTRYVFATPNQRFLIHALASTLVAMYLQGMANQVIFHPTYTWSFFCVVLTVLFLSMQKDIPHLEADYLERLEEETHQEYEQETEENMDGYPNPLPS